MPLFNDDMDIHQIAGSHYGFSAERIDNLGAAEYTLVGIAADVSGSVAPFLNEIEDCIRAVVRACRHSPRSDNLMLRTTIFDNRLDELHGFKLLADCDPDAYSGALRSGGATALYDAAHNLVESVDRYGKTLTDSDFTVNGIVFVITDGEDNHSSLSAGSVKKALASTVRNEDLESFISILVGVGIQDDDTSEYLEDFKKYAGFTQYIEIADTDEAALARLADFVSRSISAQSRSLGTGATPSLTF